MAKLIAPNTKAIVALCDPEEKKEKKGIILMEEDSKENLEVKLISAGNDFPTKIYPRSKILLKNNKDLKKFTYKNSEFILITNDDILAIIDR